MLLRDRCIENCKIFQKQTVLFSLIDAGIKSDDVTKLQYFKLILDYFSYCIEKQLDESLLQTNKLQVFSENFDIEGFRGVLTYTEKMDQKLILQQSQCHSCKIYKEQSSLNCLGSCYQIICKECISKLINTNLHQGFDKISCSCGQLFVEDDLKIYLGKEYVTLLKKHQQLSAFTCKSCKLTQPVNVGSEIYGLKDPVTKTLLDRTQSEHYRFNRVKCPGCKIEQCRKCQSIPYHIGKNCEEFQLEAQKILCRYCESVIPKADINLNLPEPQRNICRKAECFERIKTVCSKLLPCKHPCFGFANEIQCPPCLEAKFCEDSQVKEQKTDFCSICEAQLKKLPIIRSKCGHIFHYECIDKRLQENKLNGSRIVFNFCYCPICREWLQFPPCVLEEGQRKNLRLLEYIKTLSKERLELEGRIYDSAIKRNFNNRPVEYALSIYCYYECFKCQKPYFGGLNNQQDEQENNTMFQYIINEKQKLFNNNYKELICPQCCQKESKCQHGEDSVEYKCKYCCSLGVYFCYGTTHFCESCYQNQLIDFSFQQKPNYQLPQCNGPGQCPSGGNHRPNGEEQIPGCWRCRNQKNRQL